MQILLSSKYDVITLFFLLLSLLLHIAVKSCRNPCEHRCGNLWGMFNFLVHFAVWSKLQMAIKCKNIINIFVIPLPLSVTQLPLRDYYVTAIYYVIAFLLYSTWLDSLVDYPFLPLFPSPSSFPLVYTRPLPIYLIHCIVSWFSVERRRLVHRPLSLFFCD